MCDFTGKCDESSVHQMAWRERLQAEMHEIRKDQAEFIVSSVTDCVEGQCPRLIMVTGPSGSGKSHLVRSTLLSFITEKGGYFISGSFNVFSNHIPYSAFVEAFTEFANCAIERGSAEVERIRTSILENVQQGTVSLTKMIPVLSRLIPADDEQSLSPRGIGASQRFLHVFLSFLKSLGSLQLPIVILLDDLELADPLSLDLIVSISTDAAAQGIVFVGTCDPSKAIESKTLSAKLCQIEEKLDRRIVSVELAYLDEPCFIEVVSKSLGKETNIQFVQLLFRLSSGSLLLLVQCLEWLRESGSVVWDSVGLQVDVDEVESALFDQMRSSKDMITKRLLGLEEEDRAFLKSSACLGFSVDHRLGLILWGERVRDFVNRLSSLQILACQQRNCGFMFAHPQIQAACYEMIPSGEKPAYHLDLGRKLWQIVTPSEREEYLFPILAQYMSGTIAIHNRKEKVVIAATCYTAGQKAANTGAFSAACRYLNCGLELLGQDGWRDNYELTLAIYNAAAEMEMCSSNYDRMDFLVGQILRNASGFQAHVQAYATKIYQLGVAGNHNEAIEIGLTILKNLGEPLQYPYRLHQILREYKRVKRLLRNKSNEQLLRLPEMLRADKLSCLRILQLIYHNAIISRPKLVPCIQLRMMLITMIHGSSVFASSAFVAYGMLSLVASEDIDEANRYGELALSLLDRYGAAEYVPRVYAFYYGIIFPWKYPIVGALEPLLSASVVGQETGDFDYAAFCVSFYFFNSLNGDAPLNEIMEKWLSVRQRWESQGQQAILSIALPAMDVIYRYRGLCPDPTAAQGALLNLDSFKGSGGISVLQIQGTRLILNYVFNKYDAAYTFRLTKKEIRRLPPAFFRFDLLFFTSMIALAIARNTAASRRRRRRLMREARRNLRVLRRLSLFCPSNCLHKCFLVEAELLSLKGRHPEAFQSYFNAIALAKQAGKYVLGLAYEVTGRHFLAVRLKDNAKEYLLKAYETYAEWGGISKATKLRSELQDMYPDLAFSNATET